MGVEDADVFRGQVGLVHQQVGQIGAVNAAADDQPFHHAGLSNQHQQMRGSQPSWVEQPDPHREGMETWYNAASMEWANGLGKPVMLGRSSRTSIQFFKIFFFGAAQGADPFIRQFFKGCFNRDIVFDIAFHRVVDVAAGAFPLVHETSLLIGCDWLDWVKIAFLKPNAAIGQGQVQIGLRSNDDPMPAGRPVVDTARQSI
jgi:hypothetical protein